MRTWLFPLLVLVAGGALYFLVRPEATPDVVLYCGVDQDQSRPIADAFASELGLNLLYQGETEAQRSIGLPARIEKERGRPGGDVFWSNEIMHMAHLGEFELLAPLPPDVAAAFPAAWRDPAGRYVAFGARVRVLLVNTELLPDPADWPASVGDLLDPRYGERGLQTCMAKPTSGTTKTHAVALLTRDEAAAKAFLEAVARDAVEGGQVRLTPSNGSAMSLVRDSSNKVAFCLTDTDDAWAAIQAGAPVRVVYPDQAAPDGPGALVIPNTIAVLKGAPHPERAAELVRWIVSRDNELRLAEGPSAQVPLRTDLAGAQLPEQVKRPGVDFRAMEVDWAAVGRNKDRWHDWLTRTFNPAP